MENNPYLEKLATLDAGPLAWKQLSRQSMAQFFEKASEAAAREHYGDKIPQNGLGDVFRYTLEGTRDEIAVIFSQIIRPTSPFTNAQFLTFVFGESKNPDNPIACGDGYEELRDEKIRFIMGRHSNPEFVELESQNVKLAARLASGKDQFTQQGREITEGIIARQQKLLEAAGLKPEDKKSLLHLTANIGNQFKINKLHPDNWQL